MGPGKINKRNTSFSLAAVCLALVSITLVASTFGLLPLFNEGTHTLFSVLDEGLAGAFPATPAFRYTNSLLLLVTLLVSRATGSLVASRLAFSFAYSALPWLSYVLCLRQCRRELSLLAWPSLAFLACWAFTFLAATANLVTFLAWPLLFSVALRERISPATWLGILVLYFLHPASALVLLVLAAVRLLPNRARVETSAAKRGTALALVVLAVVRVFVFHDQYEQDQMDLHNLLWSFQLSVYGWSLVAYLFLLAAAILTLWPPPPAFRWVRAVAWAGAAAASCFWLADPLHFIFSFRWRYFSTAAALPFFAGFLLQVRRGGGKREIFAVLIPTSLYCATVCALSGLHYAGWLSVARVVREMPAACDGPQGFGVPNVAVNGFLPYTSLLAQDSRQPPKIVLMNRMQCQAGGFRDAIPFLPWLAPRPRRGGWFDLTRTGLD